MITSHVPGLCFLQEKAPGGDITNTRTDPRGQRAQALPLFLAKLPALFQIFSPLCSLFPKPFTSV